MIFHATVSWIQNSRPFQWLTCTHKLKRQSWTSQASSKFPSIGKHLAKAALKSFRFYCQITLNSSSHTNSCSMRRKTNNSSSRIRNVKNYSNILDKPNGIFSRNLQVSGWRSAKQFYSFSTFLNTRFEVSSRRRENKRLCEEIPATAPKKYKYLALKKCLQGTLLTFPCSDVIKLA